MGYVRLNCWDQYGNENDLELKIRGDRIKLAPGACHEPEDVFLDKAGAAELVDHLQRWVDTGKLEGDGSLKKGNASLFCKKCRKRLGWWPEPLIRQVNKFLYDHAGHDLLFSNDINFSVRDFREYEEVSGRDARSAEVIHLQGKRDDA